MGLGDYPNFVAPNERNLYNIPMRETKENTMDKYPDPTEFAVTVPNVELKLNAADMARALSPSDIVNLVIELDGEVGEWEVTLLLHRYFKEQYDVAKREGAVPELVDASDDVLWDSLFASQLSNTPFENGGGK